LRGGDERKNQPPSTAEESLKFADRNRQPVLHPHKTKKELKTSDPAFGTNKGKGESSGGPKRGVTRPIRDQGEKGRRKNPAAADGAAIGGGRMGRPTTTKIRVGEGGPDREKQRRKYRDGSGTRE